MNKIQSITNDQFKINLTVLNECNYKCKYCCDYLQNGSTPRITADEYINFFSNLLIDNPEISFYRERIATLTGGEPSLYDGIDILAKFFKEKMFKTVMVTNGSAKEDFWTKNIPNIDNLVLSFHPRYANYNNFSKIIDIAKLENKKVSIHLLMDHQYWDRALEAADYFKQHDVRINYKGILIKHKMGGDNSKKGEYDQNYNESQLTFLKQNFSLNEDENTFSARINYTDGTNEELNPQKLISSELSRLTGYKCGAGKSSLVIKHDGSVCGSACNIGSAQFGNLVHNRNLRVKLLQDGVICSKKNKCVCIYDLQIPKQLI
jgi:organic radical activating enzyme